jgi:CheY-like chemotaxis protein
MKKIIIARDLKRLCLEKSRYLERSDVRVFTADTTDDVLQISLKEKIDMIVTQLDMPGMKSEELYGIIRKSRELREVSIIIVCQDTLAHRERCRKCKANAVLTLPLDGELLSLKVQQFLSVAPRMMYRAALAVAIEGKFKNRPLPFWTENLSANGMLIRAQEPLAKGDGIFFSFFLPDGTHVSGYGEIVRAVQLVNEPDSFQFGITFTSIDPEVKAAIEKVVKLTRRK